MRLTAAFCREQAALQHGRAVSEPLTTRRKIALDAANAWTAEAVLAEKRDSKRDSLDKLDAEITEEFAREASAEGDEEQ